MLGDVVVTGANGWVGKRLVNALDASGITWTGFTRQPRPDVRSAQWLQVRDDFKDIEATFPKGVGTVVHLAARVHQMHDSPRDSLQRYRASNRDATVRLARAAKESGVARFIFVSSIKALGEIEPGRPWRESDTPTPTDPYGISKLEAEVALIAMKSAAFNPTIVRLPLVYGAGVRANFARLADAVIRGVPIPLGAATAKRSLVGMENLIDALLACLQRPNAMGETFHIADAETPSVRELVDAIGVAVGRRPRLISIPIGWLKAGGRIAGHQDSIMRLTSPLRLDTHHIQSALGWTPPLTLAQGLEMAFKR